MKTLFDSYQIREVGEWDVTGGGEMMCEPFLSMSEEEQAQCERTYWSIYGWRHLEGVECIADRDTYQDIADLYHAITGLECGDDPQDHFDLPTNRKESQS